MIDRHYLIGTAGHVDHGKTELIRAMSGMETDRLKEEKQRGISIELGFAHMTLPSGREVGIVDVPGHERFVRQMLAGASGMDLVLLVIAADEGIMPQTREHLNILTLLGISRIIVVLNKIDLVDEEWGELIEEEIRLGLKDTVFAGASICPVSSLNRQGIPELLLEIDDQLKTVESKKTVGPVRMPLDRIFSIQGFGTVVAGTLYSGTVKLGQELAIEPGRVVAKVRSIQVHGKKVISAIAGQRVAINLAGVEVSEVAKGAVLTSPKVFKVGNILDLLVQNLSTTEKAIEQRQRLRFHIGTTEVIGRIHLLEQEEILPGQKGYAQILLESPVLAAAGDHFVLRLYSPIQTVAGGKVLGVADNKQKRFKEGVLAHMRLKDKGDPLELLEKELEEPNTLLELIKKFHIEGTEIRKWLEILINSERLEIWKEDGVDLYWAKSTAERWRSKLVGIIKAHQKAYPLRRGLGREELKEKMGVSWNHHRWQSILEHGDQQTYFKLSGSKVLTNTSQELPVETAKKLDCLRKYWIKVGLMPPELVVGAQSCGILPTETTEYALYLCEQKEWTSVSGFYFVTQTLENARNSLNEYLNKYNEVSVAEVKELWKTSRKYTVPLLEYFDQQHLTRRQGDKRVLFNQT
ncbi:MAG: selenocysteine-specific translation elongation factor [Desulfitobacteriaceae bacterium]